jgi:hypothetical protein
VSRIDPPSARELLPLVAEFLTRELAPVQTDEKLRYRTLAAANLLRIARRELDALGQLHVDADGYAVPAEVIEAAGSLRAFTADLAEGRRSITDPATFDLAMRYVEAKLAVADPQTLARQSGMEKS